MANKSPADFKSEGAELKALLAKVKKKQHNCAILMSKDGIVIEVHIKKSPEVLLKAAKKAGGSAKGVWGTMTMDGQVIIIDPVNDKIPGNLTKIAKKFFAERGLKNRMEIKEPEEAGTPEAAEEEAAALQEEAAAQEEEAAAQAHEEESAEEEADTKAARAPQETKSASQASPAAAEDPRQKLQEKLKDIQPRIDELDADTESVMHRGLADTMGLFNRAMKDELFDRAADALTRVISVLDDYDGLMAQKRPLLARMAAMAKDAEKITKGEDSEAARAMPRLIREFEYSAANNEWYSAGERLDQIKAMIEAAGMGGDEAPEASPSEPEEPAQTPPSTDEANAQQRKTLQAQLDVNKKEINEILKNKDSDIGKAVVLALTRYSKALKGDKLDDAKAALDEVSEILAQAPQDGSESDHPDRMTKEQKQQSFDALKNIQEQLSKLLPNI